jgi:O-antigen/teichoic acid export membrane protein|nr:oligosaccharide flippase family protein [uncultured Psychroserpens sp.]
MLEKLKKYRNSEFAKNILKLASGSTVAQVISILCAPIVYRIYDRSDYGLLGLFMATTGIIAVFSTLQYLNTILIAKTEDESSIALSLNRFLNIFLSLLCLLLVFPIYYLIPNLINAQEFGAYFFLIPLSIYFNGQNEIFKTYANRKKEYNIILINTILIAVVSPLLSIPLGLIFDGPFGLFFSLIFGQFTAYVFLLLSLKKKYNLDLKTTEFKTLYSYAKENLNYPKYILPTEFLGRYARQLPVFMINRFFGLEVLGVYNLAVRMLGLPSQLITGSISSVFKQRVAQEIATFGQAIKLFNKTLLSLAAVVVLPIIVITLFGPELFGFVFGEKWIAAGEMSRILIWLFSVQMIVSPLSYLFLVRNRMKETFYCHIYILVSCLCIFYWSGAIMKYSLNTTLIFYVVNYCLVYGYYLIRSFQFSRDYEG